MTMKLQNAAEELNHPVDGKRLSVVPTPRTGEVIPMPDKNPTIHLKTLHDVRIEMAKVYRAMKTQELETQEGTRLVYVLSQLSKVIETQQIDERTDAIDRVLKHRRQA